MDTLQRLRLYNPCSPLVAVTSLVGMAGYSKSGTMVFVHQNCLISHIPLQMLSSMSTPAPHFYIANSKGSNRNMFIPLRRTDFNIFQDPSVRIVRFREEMPEFSLSDSRTGRNRNRFYSPYPTSSQEPGHYRARNHQANVSRHTGNSNSVSAATHTNTARMVSRAATPRITTRADAPRTIARAGTPRLPPVNESRAPRTDITYSPPMNDLEPGSDVSTAEDDSSEQDEEEPFSEKIPKPEGEAGRPNRGGYNLAQELNWSGQDFETVRVRILLRFSRRFR